MPYQMPESGSVEHLDRATLHLKEPLFLKAREQAADGFELQAEVTRDSSRVIRRTNSLDEYPRAR